MSGLSAAHTQANFVIGQEFRLKLGPAIVTPILGLVGRVSLRNLNDEYRLVWDFRKAHALNANAKQVRADISFDQLLQAFRRQGSRNAVQCERETRARFLIFVNAKKELTPFSVGKSRNFL